MSKRLSIIEALAARLAQIRVVNGYATDAGRLVIVGEAGALSDDDPETAVALVVRDDVVGYVGEQLSIQLQVEVQAVAKADLDAPWQTIENILADVKKAIESGDRTLGKLAAPRITRGSTRTLDREVGTTTVGVAVTYIVPYVEVWGQP